MALPSRPPRHFHAREQGFRSGRVGLGVRGGRGGVGGVGEGGEGAVGGVGGELIKNLRKGGRAVTRKHYVRPRRSLAPLTRFTLALNCGKLRPAISPQYRSNFPLFLPAPTPAINGVFIPSLLRHHFRLFDLYCLWFGDFSPTPLFFLPLCLIFLWILRSGVHLGMKRYFGFQWWQILKLCVDWSLMDVVGSHSGMRVQQPFIPAEHFNSEYPISKNSRSEIISIQSHFLPLSPSRF